MERELLPSIRGHVRALRNIWNSRVQRQEEPPIAGPIRAKKQRSDYKEFSVPNPTIITFEIANLEDEEPRAPVEEQIEPVMICGDQRSQHPRAARQHWHLARHVFRSGLALQRLRCASDSILPILKKTRVQRSPTDSIDSTFIVVPVASLVDYLSHEDSKEPIPNESLLMPNRIKRVSSDRTDCIRRNKLEESIAQYERILQHLKNYEQFMVEFSVSSISTPSVKQRRKSFDEELIPSVHEGKERVHSKVSQKSSHSQSLSYHVGRTFSEFVLQDLFSTTTPSDSTPTENESPINDDLGLALNELDTALENALPLTANSPVHVIVINSPQLTESVTVVKPEQPLIERLFDGKKSAFETEQCVLQPVRLPKSLIKVYEIANKKSLDPSENVLYATKMIKIGRHHYKQDTRLFCLTSKKIYNITRKNSTVKESLLLDDIVGVSCTPYKDGFICIHTKPSANDRGDWLLLVDYPCELITHLFEAIGRDSNHDNFLKFQSKISPRRQGVGDFDIHDDSIEIRLSSSFHLKANGKNSLIIFTP